MSGGRLIMGDYCPKGIVNNINTKVLAADALTEVRIQGFFLDQFDDIVITRTSGTGSLTLASIDNSNPFELVFEIQSGIDIGVYSFELLGICENYIISDFQVKNLTLIIPKVVSPPTNPNPLIDEWTKPTVVNNDVVLGTGTFEAEGSGDGWNDHAYFGGVTSNSQIDFSMKIDGLNDGGTAYCFIKFNNTNNVSTSGNPRLYIFNGSTIRWYSSTGVDGGQNAIQEDDLIRMSITPTSAELFINGVSVYSDYNSYNLTNLFVTFTAYRALSASNIKLEVYQ